MSYQVCWETLQKHFIKEETGNLINGWYKKKKKAQAISEI